MAQAQSPILKTQPDPQTSDAGHREYAIRVAIALGVAAGFIAAGLTLYLASEVFVLAGAGILVAVLLSATTDFLARHTPLSRGWALALILLVAVAALGFGVWRLASNLDEQVRDLSKTVVESTHKIEERLNKYDWGRRTVDGIRQMQPPTSGNAELFGRFTRFASSTLGGIVDAVIILFLGVYLAADPRTYRSGLIRLFPLAKRPRTAEVVDRLGHTLKRWLVGQVLVMFIVGVAVTIGLWLIGVPFAPVLGLLTFALEFVPYVGPIASAIPGLLVASSLDSTNKLLYTAILYFAVQSAEGYLLSPLIQERAVKIPPALTILAQVLLGVLVGGIGLILATPLTAVALVLVNELYIRDALGDQPAEG